jgi:hypothetical protein
MRCGWCDGASWTGRVGPRIATKPGSLATMAVFKQEQLMKPPKLDACSLSAARDPRLGTNQRALI